MEVSEELRSTPRIACMLAPKGALHFGNALPPQFDLWRRILLQGAPGQAPLYHQLVVVRECPPDTLLPFSHGSLLSSRAFCPWKGKVPFRGRESRRAIACKRLPNWDLATWLLYIVNILPVSIYGGNIPNGFARNMYLP